MSYKKKFLNKSGVSSPISGINSNSGAWNGSPGQNGSPTGGWNNTEFGYKNYQSRLPEVYTGHPNRIERYNNYETMACDAEINSCLDIISEFSTQRNEHNRTPFTIDFKEDPTPNEVEIVGKQLQQWCKLNQFDLRMFKIFRNTIMYGDQVFIRDPENFKLYWIDMLKVIKVIVNESEGKNPEQYVIRDININLQNLTAAQKTNTDFAANPTTGFGAGGGANTSYTVPAMPYNTTGSRFTLGQSESAIDSKHILHLSLTEGLDRFWPFGQSILENIFKVYKQKELLEDAILIYRVQRAPERRVFKIDVGEMPSHLAMAFVERIKNEIHQRRIPSHGGGGSVVDATYSPLCLDLDTKIPLLDGRTISLNEIIVEFEAGKENWAYSCDPVTGKVVPGIINWAGITRKNTEAIKITFDNGKTLTCTPDHKIPVFGKGFVEAENLTENDSLIAFNTRLHKISDRSSEYQQVWDHYEKKWVYTHRLVGDFFKAANAHKDFVHLEKYVSYEKNIIHHVDFDRFNNSPENLVYMNKADHIIYHSTHIKDFWRDMTDEYRTEYIGRIASTLKEHWKNMSDEDRNIGLSNIRTAQKKAVWNRVNNPESAARYKINAGASRRKYFEENPEVLKKYLAILERRIKIKNQSLNLTFDMLQHVANIVKSGHTKKNTVLDICDRDQILLDMVRKENSIPLDYRNAQCKIDFNKFGYSKMDRLLKKFGYSDWRHFVKEIDNFNHRVVKIEKVSNRDTGTITIDGLHQWHDYHTFAIDSGIFVKNSVNEDYYFPVSASGRGSSIEVLPGGCLAMDTKVSLLDGRELSIIEISDELATGEELWTYSCEPLTGKIVPGIISWAGMTQESAKVMRITLDNNETVICTPDHPFPTYDQIKKRADEFKVGDGLIPRKKESIHNHTIAKIEYLEERIPVGTLTIDQNEVYHGYHTFALSANILIFNSNLSEIDDLKYFNNRLARGLRIPSSYLPTGPDDNTTPLSDGRVGTAMIQEFRFNQYCERLQNYICIKLDEEFKLFLKWRGLNIDPSIFQLRFNPPQNFASYRQAEMDNARVSTFGTIESLPYIAKRFALERFLGLSEEEIKKNERLWAEENKEDMESSPAGTDLRNVGVSVGDFNADTETADQIENSGEEDADGLGGPEVVGPVGDGQPAGGGGAPGPAAGGGAGGGGF